MPFSAGFDCGRKLAPARVPPGQGIILTMAKQQKPSLGTERKATNLKAMIKPLSQSPAWKALAAHYKQIQKLHLRKLFAEDAKRVQTFTAEAGGQFLDFPKNRITNQTLCLLLPLARESGLHDKTDAMFSGATVNVTENSAVLQVALRAPKGATVIQWFWKKAGGLGFTLLLLLSVSVVRAQDAASQAATSSVATNTSSGAQSGKRQDSNTATSLFEDSTSDNSQVPAHVRPFLLTTPPEHLLSDWDGLLPKLEDWGITPTLTYESDSAGNASGGRSQGFAYADNIGLGLLFDLEKLIDLVGGSVLLSMSQRDGNSLSQKRVGNVFTIQQVYGGETYHLIDLAYQQKLFNDRVELSLGRIGAGDDFLVCQYDYLFMQNGFDGNPVGIFFNAPGSERLSQCDLGGAP